MGLLDAISNIKFEPNPVGMGLLGLGAQMMQSSNNQRTPIGFGNMLGSGLEGFNNGLQQYQQYQAELQKFSEDKDLKDAQAQYYLAHARSFDNGGPDANLLNSVKTMVNPDGSLQYVRVRKNGTFEPTGIKAPMSLENGMVSVATPEGGYQIKNAPGVESSKYAQSAATQAGKESETIVSRDVIDPNTGQVMAGVRAPQKSFVPNNNFGNIKTPDLNDFSSYKSPEEGLKAIDNLLANYGKSGVNTLSGVISKWSPSTENNTNALISSASKYLGINPDQTIDLSNPATRAALIPAIIKQEHGNTGLYGNGIPAGAIKSAEEKATTEAKNQRDQNESMLKARDNLLPARDNSESVMQTADKLLSHPALDSVIGKPDWFQKNAFLNGSPQADFMNMFNQLKGQGFVGAFQSLKGAGAISDREGEAATNAISRMSTATSKQAFQSAVNDFKLVIKKGLNRAYDMANGKQFEPETLEKPSWLIEQSHFSPQSQNAQKIRRWIPEKGALE